MLQILLLLLLQSQLSGRPEDRHRSTSNITHATRERRSDTAITLKTTFPNPLHFLLHVSCTVSTHAAAAAAAAAASSATRNTPFTSRLTRYTASSELKVRTSPASQRAVLC